MNDWITAILLLCGSSFALLAAIGAVRLPDVFLRMHATTKSGTLGVGCMLLALAIHFGRPGITMRVFLVIAILFMTIPVAAHMIARAAYFIGHPLWENSVIDHLRDQCGLESHTIQCPAPYEDGAEDKGG